MFQSFDDTSCPETGPERLTQLRGQMRDHGLAGFLIPRADAHQGEYVAAHDARLAWLTGFTGSAGFCAALLEEAGVFIDGRYRTQVKSQVALSHFTPVPWPETRLASWLLQHLPTGGVVGFDPWLHSAEEIEALENSLANSAISLRANENLIDAIWPDQPAPPQGRIIAYPADLAGESHERKRKRLAGLLRQTRQKSAVLTLPDSIGWLLNIRGSDIARNPVPHCFAILHDDARLTVFVDADKMEGGLNAHLGPQIALRPVSDFGPVLRSLAGPVRLDRGNVPWWVVQQLDDAGVPHQWGEDPCILPKARKNATEVTASRNAHLRDGAAFCEFLAWFDAQPSGALTEIDVVTSLEGFRRATGALRDISFDTIAGSGPNGAIIHYRVSEKTNRTLSDGDLLVLDSGGQYLDGTTDITRTLPVGQPGAEECAIFTRVLQGMIAISRLRWPKGLAGRDLDAIARYPLWLAGLDYDHGTGHGVGVYLCVHEGPQRLSRAGNVPLEPGMILSNEPGYYREGTFGIRIENLLVVQSADALAGADARDMMSFATLTHVPIQRRLICLDMLSDAERDWLDGYHTRCREALLPHVTASTATWLLEATAPL